MPRHISDATSQGARTCMPSQSMLVPVPAALIGTLACVDRYSGHVPGHVHKIGGGAYEHETPYGFHTSAGQ